VGPGTWLLLAVGILGVSTSGPLIAATAAPALAIAFWRNALASAVLVPITVLPAVAGRRHPKAAAAGAAVERVGRLRGLDRRAWGACAVAGVLLAAHFGTWVPSVTMTSVAAATALVCIQPVWAALLATHGGRAVGRQTWLGIALAVLGVLLVTGADVTVSGRAVAGDVLALVGGVFGAGYVTVGERVRSTVSTTIYTAVCYTVCALTLLAVCLLAGVPLVGYDPKAWLLIVAVTIGAQFLGHSVLNRILDRVSATVLSVAILLEVPGAAALAFVFLDQRPPLLALPGLALVLVGLAVVVAGARPPATAQPEV
jgi:drug/metabolite transporter (DMT)-like permease